MGDIKRQINSITDLKRGATDVNFVYRGSTLVWERGGTTVTQWLTTGLNIVLGDNKAGENVYVTSGLNLKLK
jgi:hypothetical protein